MRSPEARALLDSILKEARWAAYNGEVPRSLERAILAYDDFCNEPHYSLSMDLASSNTSPYVNTQGTKADHFQLPRGV